MHATKCKRPLSEVLGLLELPGLLRGRRPPSEDPAPDANVSKLLVS